MSRCAPPPGGAPRVAMLARARWQGPGRARAVGTGRALSLESKGGRQLPARPETDRFAAALGGGSALGCDATRPCCPPHGQHACGGARARARGDGVLPRRRAWRPRKDRGTSLGWVRPLGQARREEEEEEEAAGAWPCCQCMAAREDAAAMMRAPQGRAGRCCALPCTKPPSPISARAPSGVAGRGGSAPGRRQPHAT